MRKISHGLHFRGTNYLNQKIKNEKKKISLLPGDGIGKEISVEAKKILNWINENTDIDL